MHLPSHLLPNATCQYEKEVLVLIDGANTINTYMESWNTVLTDSLPVKLIFDEDKPTLVNIPTVTNGLYFARL